MQSLIEINQKIVRCKKCPRLAAYIRKVAKEKVKRFKNCQYWGRPLVGFGDIKGKLLIIGLAPAAHGGNRTGRLFTGDSSGDWLAKILYENGFASRPTSVHINDGFVLTDAYITCVVRCAPPQNNPSQSEINNCSNYLRTEISMLENIKVIVCLGRISFDSCCKLLDMKKRKFGHGKIYHHKGLIIISSYHPSRQNTQTGRLTWKQWSEIFSSVREILDKLK